MVSPYERVVGHDVPEYFEDIIVSRNPNPLAGVTMALHEIIELSFDC